MLRQRDPDTTIKYIVSTTGGDFVIEIPASWKVTFGYVNPAQREGGYRDGHCLRVWEGEKLRGVWGHVTGFRDLSIPLARKVERQAGTSAWTMDSNGGFSKSQEVKVDSEFVLEAGEDVPF